MVQLMYIAHENNDMTHGSLDHKVCVIHVQIIYMRYIQSHNNMITYFTIYRSM